MPCEVHVWHAQLAVQPLVLSALERVLSVPEVERANRFHFSRDRRQFVATRALLRTLLGRSLHMDPARLEFGAGAQGKPYLARTATGHPPRFNVAHSGDHALIGMSAEADVGVDIEVVRDAAATLPIADRFFSAGESAAIRLLPEDQRQLAFFRLWTLKEAFVKAVGAGLSHPLNAFEVTTNEPEFPRLTIPGEAQAADGGWSLRDLSNPPEYAAALAVRGNDLHVLFQEISLEALA
jgi:4'-phosphopantetheinyl transferase